MAISPEFTGLAAALSGAIAAYLLLVEPWLGRRAYERLRRARERDPRALTRFYRSAMLLWWPFAALVGVILWISPGLRPADLGLVAPEDPGFSLAVIAGAAAAAAAMAVWMWRAAPKGVTAPGLQAVSAMLPRTPRERGWAAGMAVTAGVCEEVVYRGLLIAFGVGVLGLPVWAAAALSVAVFVAGHAYQGWRAMVPVAAIAVALTVVYVNSASLLVPIAVHALIDLRSLALAPRTSARPAGEAAPTPEPARG